MTDIPTAPIRRNPRRVPSAPASILLGPVLHARGGLGPTGSGQRWRVSAMFLLDGDEEPADLRVDGVTLAVPPRFMHEWRNLPPVGPVGEPCPSGVLRLWRFDFAVPRGLQDGRAAYGFDGDERRWFLSVPGTAAPPRLAYTSCGGCEDEAKIAAGGLTRNERWAHLLSRHRSTPLHLILMGGDQVYADELWHRVPALKAASDQRLMRRRAMGPAPDLTQQLEAWYLATYRHAWNQPEVAALLSSVAGFRMWDDHDIVDGWGSHPMDLLESPIYQAIYMAARRAFRLFQVGMNDDDPADTLFAEEPPSFTQGMMINGIGVLAPDLRSERQPEQVLSPATLAAMPAWLDRFQACSHLLLMSSVPLIFPGFGWAERLLKLLPGRQLLEDDLRDQWRSPAHSRQWRTMLGHLSDFVRRSGTRVTILSGEVHLAAHGRLTGPGVDIHQLVSSGIVHPPPHGLAVSVMEHLSRKKESLPGRSTLSMQPLTPSGKRLLTNRNYLTLTGRDDGGLTAEWHAEGLEAPIRIEIG